MANIEQVAVLRDKNVTEWNNWRKANPALRPDLRKADLSEANLNGLQVRFSHHSPGRFAEHLYDKG